jgi:hypothetical protein
VVKIAQIGVHQELPYLCPTRYSQWSVSWTVGKTKRRKGTKIMAVADRHDLPVAASVESATTHEMKLVVPTFVGNVIPEPETSLVITIP